MDMFALYQAEQRRERQAAAARPAALFNATPAAFERRLEGV